MKKCTRCKNVLPLENFGKKKGRKDGLQSWCRGCKSKDQLNKTYKKSWRASNPDKCREYSSDWAKRNPERIRERKLRKFGITTREYDQMFLAQNGVCAVCRKSEQGRRLAVDHCHETGVVRGLLCSGCNTAIGHMADDPLTLRNAADYLEKSRCCSRSS